MTLAALCLGAIPQATRRLATVTASEMLTRLDAPARSRYSAGP